MSSSPVAPSKRLHDGNHTEPNGREKLRKLAGDYSEDLSSKSSSSGVMFRVLCPVTKTDGIIGKDGEFLARISDETGVTIRVEEDVSGSDERLIVIQASDNNKGTSVTPETSAELSEHDGGEKANVADESDNTKEDSKNYVDKESALQDGLKSEKETANVQKALLLVFERIVEAETETEAADEDNTKSSKFNFRFLILSSQTGYLLGNDGCTIKQMSAESGAEIKILPRDQLPMCALASDEVVQVTGEVDTMRKAIESISHQLLGNSPRDHESIKANPTGPSHPSPVHSSYAVGYRDVADNQSAIQPSIPKFRESGIPGRFNPSQEILTFRLLCHDERVGGVIGKGGSIIRMLKQETGCDIKVMEAVPGIEDRLIVVSGPAHPDDGISAPQDAVLRVQTRIARAVPDNREQTLMARLLVPSSQIGCLLGKGGAVIAEMRKSSGAYIRILGKDQVPKCASENEEVVLVSGEIEAVQEALLQITTRLRHHFFRDTFHSYNHPFNPAFMDQVSPFPTYMGRREPSPPGMYSNVGPSFHKFDAIGGPPPHGSYHPHDDHSLFVHRSHRPGMPPHMAERKPWASQGLTEVGGPVGFPDFSGPPHRRAPGFGGGSQPAIITSTTVEVVVPRSIVPIIQGEDGACLKQICQISDAKITITEAKPGATETVIIISGTPEQTHAAQSLIQAFVISESETT